MPLAVHYVIESIFFSTRYRRPANAQSSVFYKLYWRNACLIHHWRRYCVNNISRGNACPCVVYICLDSKAVLYRTCKSCYSHAEFGRCACIVPLAAHGVINSIFLRTAYSSPFKIHTAVVCVGSSDNRLGSFLRWLAGHGYFFCAIRCKGVFAASRSCELHGNGIGILFAAYSRYNKLVVAWVNICIAEAYCCSSSDSRNDIALCRIFRYLNCWNGNNGSDRNLWLFFQVFIWDISWFCVFFCVRVWVAAYGQVCAAVKRIIAYRSNTVRDGYTCKSFAVGKGLIAYRSHTIRNSYACQTCTTGKCWIAYSSNTVGNGYACQAV